MTTITLYNYTEDPDTVNKVLDSGRVLVGALYQPVDVENIIITVRLTDIGQYNYIHVEALHRYYFIGSAINKGGDLWQIRCKVDVLKSNETAILSATATAIERSNGNKYVNTREKVYSVKPQLIRADFPNTGLLNDKGQIVMVTIKGNEK